MKKHAITLATCTIFLLNTLHVYGQTYQTSSKLEVALGNMYATCFFEPVSNNPFAEAVRQARESLAPGLSSFIESNLASIPLTPPSIDAEYQDGRIVTVVTGFTPIFTESSSTVGKGNIYAGSNFSYFNLTKIRGRNLSETFFAFQEDAANDIIGVNMPLDISASVLTFYGTYGITENLDIGVALPITFLSIKNENTQFLVQGDDTGCRYSSDGLSCNAQNPNPNGGREANVNLFIPGVTGTDLPDSETYLSTIAVRAKYRFTLSAEAAKAAILLDLRVPTGRNENNVLGSGNFGARLVFIGDYAITSSFKPYLNLGAQYWDGNNTSNINFALGFNQRLASKLFFAFDLLGRLALEATPLLARIDDAPTFPVVASTIPALDRDHTLNAGLGLQLAITPSFHAYGSALFSLLDAGLQATVAPSIGASLYF